MRGAGGAIGEVEKDGGDDGRVGEKGEELHGAAVALVNREQAARLLQGDFAPGLEDGTWPQYEPAFENVKGYPPWEAPAGSRK